MNAAVAAHGTWNVDPARSRVAWSVKHLGVSTVDGGFGEFSGLLTDGRATGAVVAASVQTDDPKRDDYLRSAEFLDAEAFPELRFTAGLPDLEDGAVTGELTIRDTTLPLRLKLERSEAGDQQVELRLTGTALRRAYGLRFPQAFGAADRSVTDEVEIALDLVLVPAS
jgi:polyisoprenoid-binding protein YceI